MWTLQIAQVCLTCSEFSEIEVNTNVLELLRLSLFLSDIDCFTWQDFRSSAELPSSSASALNPDSILTGGSSSSNSAYLNYSVSYASSSTQSSYSSTVPLNVVQGISTQGT